MQIFERLVVDTIAGQLATWGIGGLGLIAVITVPVVAAFTEVTWEQAVIYALSALPGLSLFGVHWSLRQYRRFAQRKRRTERWRFKECRGQINTCYGLLERWERDSRPGGYFGEPEPPLEMMAEVRTLKDDLDGVGVWTPQLTFAKKNPELWLMRLDQLKVWANRGDIQNARKPREELRLDYST